MADYTWPNDLAPFAVDFHLQAHTGGSESPLSRVSKIYGLSAPRWVCRMSFRGGYNGSKGIEAFGPRLDGLIAKLGGRLNRIAIWDFRRDFPTGMGSSFDDLFFFTDGSGFDTAGVSNTAVVAGADTITFSNTGGGFRVGDYVGGDGRPHIVIDVSGSTLTVRPPFKTAIAAGAATYSRVSGMFRLTSDDAGANMTEVGQLSTYDLEFVEDI